MRLITILFIASIFNASYSQNKEYKLSFKIIDQETGLNVDNAQILITPCDCGGVTDYTGSFNVKLVKNTYTINISYIGYETYSQMISLDKNQLLRIKLHKKEEKLSEVIVKAKKTNDNVESTQMGIIKLKALEIKKMPMALGEMDVLRGLTFVAGVNNAGDVSNGLSVRGGSLDQNLLLYDYAPVFNPTHLFGLISVFTPEALSSVDLYRSNIPSRYGGRVTSVVDVKVKNPYVDKFKLAGGIGVLSTRLSVETPIIKDKLLLITGIRKGYTDFLFPAFSKRLKDTKANYTDGTIKLLYLPTEKDQLSFTGFYSKDFYQLDFVSRIENINSDKNQYDFATLNGTLKWIHSFNDNTNLKTVLIGSHYTPKILFPEREVNNKIEFSSNIKYLSLISEFSKKVNKKVDYYAGTQLNQYKIAPGDLNPGTAQSIRPVSLPSEKNYELSIYANINWKPIKKLFLSGGLRYTNSFLVGPYTSASFNENLGTINETSFFSKGKKVKGYDALEPRLGATFKLGNHTSIKTNYAKTNQYLQNIYNTTTPLPTSRWKNVDFNIKPQIGNTYGVGVFQNFNDNTIEVGIEGYYRDTKNVLTYKPGADFFLEEFIQKDIVQGQGKAYGVEFSIKKNKGPINGWLNYTWSRSFLRSINEKLGDRINNNQWFPSDFDRPHVVNGTINFESKYNTFSFNFTGQTGRPFTIPNGIVSVGEIETPIYLERNNSRLPVYHRLDFSWKVHFSKSKKNKRWSNNWIVTIYNIYDRNNPINIFYKSREDYLANAHLFRDSPLGAFQLSILDNPILSLTYNFTFQ
ncbi:TonB-dependent receptor [Flavivirga algicola]|uniref:TonB-dependent receptor n=1 Tax=Flavivirga algicola TaxID=2729136 RepID=A0ABX1RWV1_9FLAO|nr:TonB-dependent receptor [Flavivirga algicola]NMH87518.1 TonB-dependent receptor [Flavivirga algicola]